MRKAKLVMALYALGAILSMLGIGVSLSFIWLPNDDYVVGGWIGVVVSIILICVFFVFGFKQKRKFREQGLL